MLCRGSQEILAPTAFDPAAFLDWLQNAKPSPTWYYAVPTMHKALVLHGRSEAGKLPIRTPLRLIRSGAAHLPHVDALALHEVFGCTVLPTYSMSECVLHMLGDAPQ